MASLDIFNNDAFSLQGMTAAIDRIPEVPTVVGDLGVFEEEGIDTTTFSIEKRDGKLELVAQSNRGGPGETVGNDGRRELRVFKVPHFQRDDAIMAEEVQNVRAFGSESELETVVSKVERKMARHTRAFDFTLEHMRLGAIKGVVLDKAGSTIVNLFTEFGVVAPVAIDFVLGTSGTDIRGKCRQVLDGVADALEGFNVPRVAALCGDDFFHKLVTHPKVEDTYKNWEASVALRSDPRLPFEFGGIAWKRYHTKPKAKAANSASPMIAVGEARFIPMGVPELFLTRFAPADYMETVNTTGLPRYAKMIKMRNDKGMDIEMQTNPLCMCTMPEALFSATTSN